MKKPVFEDFQIVTSTVDPNPLFHRPIAGVILEGEALDSNVTTVVNV